MRLHPSGLDAYRSSSIAKGMPIGLSSVGSTSCSHRNGIIPSGIRPDTPEEGLIEKSLGGDLQAKQTTMASLHSTAQLERGIVATVPSAQRRETSIAPRIICGTTPCPGSHSSRSACYGQAQDPCLQPHSVSRRDILAGLLTDRGPGACPFGRVRSTELAIDVRSPDLLVQDSLNSATLFDVRAWLEPVITTKGML